MRIFAFAVLYLFVSLSNLVKSGALRGYGELTIFDPAYWDNLNNCRDFGLFILSVFLLVDGFFLMTEGKAGAAESDDSSADELLVAEDRAQGAEKELEQARDRVAELETALEEANLRAGAEEAMATEDLGEAVEFATVREIMNRNCLSCHSQYVREQGEGKRVQEESQREVWRLRSLCPESR